MNQCLLDILTHHWSNLHILIMLRCWKDIIDCPLKHYILILFCVFWELLLTFRMKCDSSRSIKILKIHLIFLFCHSPSELHGSVETSIKHRSRWYDRLYNRCVAPTFPNITIRGFISLVILVLNQRRSPQICVRGLKIISDGLFHRQPNVFDVLLLLLLIHF